MAARLDANQQLNVNDSLISANNKLRLTMQDDGNLVLYRTDTGIALWASATDHRPVHHAVMQSDGNFVCYDAAGHAYWATGTGTPGSYVVLQDDGNLVVYSPGGQPLWASSTVVDWNPMAADTGDCHLATGHWMHSWASAASNGLISGHTRTWCTIDLSGFHASAVPVLVDANGAVLWPGDVQAEKHQYGVDGAWLGNHDRTDYWTNQVDPVTLAKAATLQVIQFPDGKNVLPGDLNIIGQDLAQVIPLIATVFS